MLPENASSQSKPTYNRIARIVVDSAKLENYKAALKEGMAAAISKEPGVLMLYAVYEKDHPTHVTVFEIYADEEAYKLHIQTGHFKKYKITVQDMVKSLELTDVVPIALETKGPIGH
jgi:4-carboxymuconolactone decarboxylase